MAKDSTSAPSVSGLVPYDPSDVKPYVAMIEAFLSGRMTAGEFERVYLRAFKDDPTDWPEPIFQLLNEVFLDLDAYCPDPVLRDAFAIDEAELRTRVERSLVALRRAV